MRSRTSIGRERRGEGPWQMRLTGETRDGDSHTWANSGLSLIASFARDCSSCGLALPVFFARSSFARNDGRGIFHLGTIWHGGSRSAWWFLE
jgi:hypothetical protein